MNTTRIDYNPQYPNFLNEFITSIRKKDLDLPHNYYSLNLDSEDTFRPYEISEFSVNDFKDIIKFFTFDGDSYKWSRQSIISILNNYMLFITDTINYVESNNFENIGLCASPDNILFLDVYMIFTYLLKKYKNVSPYISNTYFFITIKDESFKISEKEDLIDVFLFSLSNYHTYFQMKKELKRDIYTNSNICKEKYDKLSLKRKINLDLSEDEYVYIILNEKGLDISLSDQIYHDFCIIQLEEDTDKLSEPLKELMNLNEDSLSIDYFYRKEFEELYNKFDESYKNLANNYLMKEEDFMNFKEKIKRGDEYIFSGFIPNKDFKTFKEIKTYFDNLSCEDIKEEILTFVSEDSNIYLTLDEILNFWEKEESFVNFKNTSKEIGKYSVKVIEILLSEDEIRLKKFKEIKKKQISEKKLEENIKNSYKSAKRETKNLIIEYLKIYEEIESKMKFYLKNQNKENLDELKKKMRESEVFGVLMNSSIKGIKLSSGENLFEEIIKLRKKEDYEEEDLNLIKGFKKSANFWMNKIIETEKYK